MTLAKEELESIGRRDPLSWGILNVDLLEGTKWDLTDRQWSIDIYGAVNPWEIERYPEGSARRLSVMKPTQIGMSTMGIVRMLHFVINWDVRVMYTLPRQADVLDFSTTRLDPTIAASPTLLKKLGSPNSVHAKRIGNSYIYIAEMSVEARMLPISALYIDEVDLSDPDNVSTALNRLDASRWKLNYFFSTPTLAGYGIHGIYNDSDMRIWIVTCPFCGHEQELDWESNVRVVGAHSNPTRVFYGCAQCSNELTKETIQKGRWIIQKPERSQHHVGFAVSQMMIKPANELFERFRDPQTRLHEFYRKSLGKPYEIGGGSLTRDDILTTCFDDPYEPEPAWDGRSNYYLGADQGNEIQVLVAKVEHNSRRAKIVHSELIPIEKGFDRLSQLVDLYRIRRGVIDASPNRHAALTVQKRFPGRILLSDYVDQKETWKAKIDKMKVLAFVTVNRTSAFDDMIGSIKKGEWALPGYASDIHPDIELVIDQLTAVKRDIETRRTVSGSEKQVAVYGKLRADHFAHCWSYLNLAIHVAHGRGTKIAVIRTSQEEMVEEEPGDTPGKETIAEITALLAEVPTDQLEDYIIRSSIIDYEMPFPLSYKMSIAIKKHTEKDIDFVAEQLVFDRRKTRKP